MKIWDLFVTNTDFDNFDVLDVGIAILPDSLKGYVIVHSENITLLSYQFDDNKPVVDFDYSDNLVSYFDLVAYWASYWV